MKNHLYIATILFLITLNFRTNPSTAQSLQTDISIQQSINSSKKPTPRNNNVTFDSQGNCVGNASISSGYQGNIGGANSIEQNRNVNHQMSCSNDSDFPRTPTVQIRTGVESDTYNPAGDFRKKYSF